ncbi:MAG: hypothetical protein HKN11_12370 [Rhizobiales bacterium]|nr:hypothetical protein [Hyphomicrobiales bacterium]
MPDNSSAMRRISHWRRFVRENGDRFARRTTADDAQRAKAAGKLALGFHFQGATPFGRDLGLVAMFYNLGEHFAPKLKGRDRKGRDGRLAGFPAANETFVQVRRLRDR